MKRAIPRQRGNSLENVDLDSVRPDSPGDLPAILRRRLVEDALLLAVSESGVQPFPAGVRRLVAHVPQRPGDIQSEQVEQQNGGGDFAAAERTSDRGCCRGRRGRGLAPAPQGGVRKTVSPAMTAQENLPK